MDSPVWLLHGGKGALLAPLATGRTLALRLKYAILKFDGDRAAGFTAFATINRAVARLAPT
jgi:hypothetical protein